MKVEKTLNLSTFLAIYWNLSYKSGDLVFWKFGKFGPFYHQKSLSRYPTHITWRTFTCVFTSSKEWNVLMLNKAMSI